MPAKRLQVGPAIKFPLFARSRNQARKKLFAKSVDQLSSEPERRRRQNQRTPPRVAIPAATALLLDFVESSARPGTAAFTLRLAARFPICHTVQPRRAFRLFISAIPRAYRSALAYTQQDAAPRAASCVERGG